ncbi:UNVERIFIED_CONTAM: hypothetical protein Slati_1103200 [Sesamum latifolium]|uniref:Uncharacterized protein n=1 Tax=Sesamum latifolium TaxID=2727402 RepID=A0AAW2XC66_9LAMI
MGDRTLRSQLSHDDQVGIDNSRSGSLLWPPNMVKFPELTEIATSGYEGPSANLVIAIFLREPPFLAKVVCLMVSVVCQIYTAYTAPEVAESSTLSVVENMTVTIKDGLYTPV